MRIITFLFAMLFIQAALGQQVFRKVKTSPDGTREIFYVLASDSATLHGRYVRNEHSSRTEGFYNNGEQDGIWTVYALRPKKFVRIQGPFKDGKRHGLWTVYSSKRKLKTKGYFKDDQRVGFWRYYNDNGELEEEGNYDNDRRVGKWSFYDEKGVLTQEYDYTAQKVISDISLPEQLQQTFRVINGGDTISTALQRPPLYIGGRAKLNRSKIIRYPIKADSVKVEVRFTVDKSGRARDFYVVNSKGWPFDQEALATVRQLPSYWIPAMHNNTTVEVEHSLTVKFSKITLRTEPRTVYRRIPNSNYWSNPYQPFIRGGLSTVVIPSFAYQACKVQIM